MPIVRSTPTERIIDGKVIYSSEKAIVSDTFFRTTGEGILVVKGTLHCDVILDSQTTDKIKIKALTSTLIRPDKGRIDEEFDEIAIEKGACVEFAYCSGNWYIMSSDGLKMD